MKYKCMKCGKIIETELYYSDDRKSLEGFGLTHFDIAGEMCDGLIKEAECGVQAC